MGRHAKVTDIISDIVVDMATLCGDPYTPISEMDLFIFFYNMIRAPIPMNNLWRLDLGRLVVPDLFVNVDQIRAMEKSIIHTVNLSRKRRVFC